MHTLSDKFAISADESSEEMERREQRRLKAARYEKNWRQCSSGFQHHEKTPRDTRWDKLPEIGH